MQTAETKPQATQDVVKDNKQAQAIRALAQIFIRTVKKEKEGN